VDRAPAVCPQGGVQRRPDPPHAGEPPPPPKNAPGSAPEPDWAQGFFQAPQSWDQYIGRQFAARLGRFFDKCGTVVLAFDNYAHVPRAKGMTQAKRRKHVPNLEDFGERSALPCSVPVGEAWTSAICNRVFKAKVIELVTLRLPEMLLKGKEGRTLIIDYQAKHIIGGEGVVFY
jgi:hypothetical protein